MKNKKPVIVIVTPQGIGGITTMAESILQAWTFETPELILFRVPRHSFRGWLEYPFSVIKFIFLLLFKNIKVCHINLSTGGSPLRKMPYILLAKSFGSAIVLQIHSGKFDYVYDSTLTSNVYKAIVRLEFRLACGILTLSNRQRLYFQRSDLRKGKQIGYLPNAVPVTLEDCNLNKAKIKKYDFVFVGRFSNEKGASDLLEALSRIKNFQISLAVVGTNELGMDLPSIAKKIDPHRLTFFGEVARDRVKSILEESSVLVLPSHVENFPLVILEAFRSRIPVISTPVGEIPVLIENNITGTLVPVHDISALSSALESYRCDPERAIAEGNRGFEKVENHFNLGDYPRKLLEAYTQFGVRIEGEATYENSKS